MSKITTDSISSLVRTIINISLNVLVICILVMLTSNYAGKAYEFGRAVFDEQAVTTEENAKTAAVTIPKGSSIKTVSEILEKAGVIENKYVFMVQLMLSDYKDSVKPGTYSLSTSYTPTEIIEIIGAQTDDEDAGKEDTK